MGGIALIFFTGDLHSGHQGIISMQDTPFASVEEMDRTLLLQYNAIERHPFG